MTVRPGIDRLVAGDARLPGSGPLGVLTNYAARTVDGAWSGEALAGAGYDIAFFLAPEHGLAAAAPAGAAIPHQRTGAVPVLSMYGSDLQPVDDAIAQVGCLVVDLQDVGCRYYTYNWTIRELMRLAARHGKSVTVLDRPNPLGGHAIEGNLPTHTDSPVCASPVPVRHALTVGELAAYNQHATGLDLELHVLRCDGWDRSMLWAEDDLPFVPPSPNLRTPEAIILYPGTCLLEGTVVSEGRGTESPFTMLGAPFVDPSLLRASIPESVLAGVDIEPVSFVPAESKWAGERCRGLQLHVTDPKAVRSVPLGLALVAGLMPLPGFAFRERFFDALAGGRGWREDLLRGGPIEEIVAQDVVQAEAFRTAREPLLLYPEGQNDARH